MPEGTKLIILHEQFEQGLIANYGLNTFAALYVASLGSVDQLFNVGEDARLDWFGSRLGVEVTVSIRALLEGLISR